MSRRLSPFATARAAATKLCIACVALLAARGELLAQAAPTAQREVLAVVERFFEAMRAKDTAAMREIFEPGARLVGMRVRPTGETVLQVLSWERFAAFAASDTRAPWIERAWTPEVRIRGTLATVWAEYDFHFGTTPSHCGVDAVQLLKTPGGWRIVSIADTYETAGCPTRAPPG